ncbi:ubiquinone anaerobic biosynthesis protein UbiU [Thiohalomonas denitrificans]|uniref:Ubiquinone biosynthesis protein UbiU n=1 Tax=Thiohalomonas denitrificans TaxID=415747 RepID=A0A1G5QIF6_9GAMM|nr:peptidase U32 family protein [Thiohalomonas denitrificans]SCZ61635.1 putative protease [Thiohalomonas denitrificans]
MNNKVELVCPAGSFPALRAAVDNGADAVYMGFRDGTNARNFPGLNFDERQARRGIEYARSKGAKVLLALNTYPQPQTWGTWTHAVDMAADLGVDALILADAGLMRYAATTHPDLRLHLSVQGSATSYEAIEFYREQFNIQRVVLPRVLSMPQVRRVLQNTSAEIEVFAFGSLCVMVEGRCYLSSYATGESPNTCGACSPAKSVEWSETSRGREVRLGGVLIDTYKPEESAGYPVLCKGRYLINDDLRYAMEEPTSLSVLDILPELVRMGVSAVKIEGRQRSPAYVAQVTRVMRQALDACQADPDSFVPRNDWVAALDKMAEGSTHTLGALERQWQ